MNPLAQLADLIAAHFNLAEVEDLCFELDITFENLEGATLDDKCRRLVLYCQRHQRLDALLARLSQLRPHVAWPSGTELSARPARLPADRVSTPAFRRGWIFVLLLAIVTLFVWRLWPDSPSAIATPAAESPTDLPSSATSEPSLSPATPVGQVALSPTQTADIPVALLEPSAFATDIPPVTLLSENLLVASPGKSSYPVILGDPAGGVHLAWWDTTARQGAAGDIFYRYRSPAGEWGEIERLTDETLEYVSEYETAIRWRPDGVVCVFLADAAAGLQQRCLENGAWTPARVIRPGFITESDPQLDGEGHPFVAYRARADEIWLEDSLLSDGLTGGRLPGLVIDSNGIFHVVWFAAEDGPYRLLHRWSADSGATWSAAEKVTAEAPLPDIPFTLLADAAGGVHLVWNGFAGGHYYQSWLAASGWSSAEALPGQAQNNCTSVDLQNTSGGTLLFSWQGHEGVFVTVRPPGEDQGWITPFQASARSCRGPGPEMAVLPDRRFFLVYSDQRDDQTDLYGAELVVEMDGS